MADFRAAAAIGESVIQLLRMNYDRDDFNNELEFKVCLAKDFSEQPISAGVSFFLYRVFANGAHRIPAGRRGNGAPFQPQLPLDFHFLLSAWGDDASLQHAILGWMMRTLEDYPVLPGALLNAVAPGVFQTGETLEIALAELTNEDMFRIWETLAENRYQISVPYLARNVRIESIERIGQGGGTVQERQFDYAVPSAEAESL